MMKITPVRVDSKSLKVCLCGQFTKEYVPELERTLSGEGAEGQTVALDLANVTFVDREAMVFLCSAKSKNNRELSLICGSLDPAGTSL